MLASYQWLKSLLPQLSASPDELAARLTSAGVELEGRTVFGEASRTCVVARVVSMRPHPSRSGLRLVTVDRGGGTPEEIVCGAPNVPEPGGLVVLAPLGTHLPAKGLTIEKRAIGGIESAGMLCSETELGLGDDGAGILVLPAGSATPGTTLAEAVPASSDIVFSINLTPNRPDCLGHVGLAREIATLFRLDWTMPEARLPDAPGFDGDTRLDSLIRVTIEDGERCPHYGAAAVLGVTVKPSPLWVRYRLASLGVRAISNLVDVTNLVMLEYGHPMHAFDLDLVRKGAIVVRRARAGEIMATLDGVERKLDADDLLICDGEGPVALAGVMGGANTEIRAVTKRVLLECAYFDPRGIRRASRRHALHTESSHRFERGVDHGDTMRALARAAALVEQLGGGKVVGDMRRTTARELERPVVQLRSARLDQLLGVHVDPKESADIVTRLGFDMVAQTSDALMLSVPTHRPDVTRECDVIDEVARVRGLETIPAVLPAIRPRLDVGGREEIVRRARAAAVELGLGDALTFTFVTRRVLEVLSAPEPTVELQNPLSELQAVMRTSLLPGLCESVARAVRHGERDVRLFAVGPIFLPLPEAKPPVEERLAFAAILAGERHPHLAKPEGVDVWEAKGVALGWLERMTRRKTVDMVVVRDTSSKHLHPRGAATVSLDGRVVGRFGPIHPDVAEALEVPPGTLVVEMDLAAVAELGQTVPRYQTIARFPASTRDVSLVVADSVPAGDVERAVREAAGKLGEGVTLFDRFVGGAVPAGHASLAFHVVYRAGDRTLTDAEVDAQHAKVVETVHQRFGATLRS
jgi:phenylalanyl-tRNA synthetase beta chain